jgi:hypothetical protein
MTTTALIFIMARAWLRSVWTAGACKLLRAFISICPTQAVRRFALGWIRSDALRSSRSASALARQCAASGLTSHTQRLEALARAAAGQANECSAQLSRIEVGR